MDIEGARAFLREHHRAVLSTFRPDGRPQMSPVSIAVDNDGRPVVSTRETAYKVRHLRRDPRVSICAFSEDFWNWIQIDGTATVVALPDAMEPLIDYYRSVQGEHPDWDDYRRAMQEQRRVIVRVEIERAGPNTHG
ncbi:MAG: PPOX class F420-dependent oxidoreductase [Actinomycetota bacterium]|nr:PPOX class F420-dependent oxidoreductase [Actinomycetota bacterium]